MEFSGEVKGCRVGKVRVLCSWKQTRKEPGTRPENRAKHLQAKNKGSGAGDI